MLFQSKQLRVGVPMVGVVLVGYLSLSNVLQGRIRDHDAQHLNESPKIPDARKNKGGVNHEEEVKRAQSLVKDDYELKSVRNK